MRYALNISHHIFKFYQEFLQFFNHLALCHFQKGNFILEANYLTLKKLLAYLSWFYTDSYKLETVHKECVIA